MSARSRRAGVIAVGLAIGGWNGTAAAQAICSAPHSSPALAGGGTLQTLAPGAGWFQVSLFRQVSDQFFDPNGDRRDFLAGGRVRTRSVYLTGAVGILYGLDVWLQLPLHDVRFTDQGGMRSRSGAGDPRIAVRLNPELLGVFGVPLALRAGVKFPGTSFPVDATIIPLSEGQRDWEVSLESGTALRSVGPLRYVAGWIGYRWRERNTSSDRKPGNEWFAHLALGGVASGFHVEVAAEALFGRAPRQLGLVLPAGGRDLLQLVPTIGYGLGPGTIEATAVVPIAGTNLPTGRGGSVGYRLAWGGL